MGPKKKNKLSPEEPIHPCILHFEECHESKMSGMSQATFEKNSLWIVGRAVVSPAWTVTTIGSAN